MKRENADMDQVRARWEASPLILLAMREEGLWSLSGGVLALAGAAGSMSFLCISYEFPIAMLV